MRKKIIIEWIFFSVLVGFISLGLKWIIVRILKNSFSYLDILSELALFNLVLSINGLKDLYESRDITDIKKILFLSLIFFCIAFSVFYALYLIYSYGSLDLDTYFLYHICIFSSIFCLANNFFVQFLRKE